MKHIPHSFLGDNLALGVDLVSIGPQHLDPLLHLPPLLLDCKETVIQSCHLGLVLLKKLHHHGNGIMVHQVSQALSFTLCMDVWVCLAYMRMYMCVCESVF